MRFVEQILFVFALFQFFFAHSFRPIQKLKMQKQYCAKFIDLHLVKW